MSEELSRLKSRQKKRSGEGKTSGKSKKTNPRSDGAPRKSNHTRTTTATLSRKARRPAASAKGSNAGNKEQQEESVPSRSNTYSSERVRLSKMFVNSLIFIFVILLVALLWWGIEGAPPLRTLW